MANNALPPIAATAPAPAPAQPVSKATMFPGALQMLQQYLPQDNPNDPLFFQNMNPERDKWEALMQAGLGMASAASQPGATVLGSFGQGGMAGLQSMQQARQQRQQQAMQGLQLGAQLSQLQAGALQPKTISYKKTNDDGQLVDVTEIYQGGQLVDTKEAPVPMKDPKVTQMPTGDVDENGNPIYEFTTWQNGRPIGSSVGVKPPATQVNMGQREDFDKNKSVRKRYYETFVPQANAAVKVMQTTQEARSQLDKIRTGPLENAVTGLVSVGENLGVDVQGLAKKHNINLNNVGDAEKFNFLSGQLLLNTLESGVMKGTLSDSDMKELKNTITKMGFTEEANRYALDFIEKRAKTNLDKAINYGEKFQDVIGDSEYDVDYWRQGLTAAEAGRSGAEGSGSKPGILENSQVAAEYGEDALSFISSMEPQALVSSLKDGRVDLNKVPADTIRSWIESGTITREQLREIYGD